MKPQNKWPALPYNEWKDTLDALHMKMQVVGKVKLELAAFLNQWWHVAFHLNASGMTTGLIPYNDILFELNFDFIKHNLFIKTSDGRLKEVPFTQCSVAEFYADYMDILKTLDINVTINTLPAEVSDPVHCFEDMRRAYDKEYIHRWWQVLIQSGKVFESFRSSFTGKSSPIHFYWGSFDLNGTRHSGKKADPPETGGRIMQFGENEENYAFGFWPGNMNFPKPAFYSYIYPAPKGIENIKIKPQAASFNSELGEFILDYDDVRNSGAPDEMIMEFLNSTYEGSAELAGWDTENLKAQIPV